MKRWNSARIEEVENATIDAFLTEILAVCKKHTLSLGHEDTQGGFEVWPYNEHDVNWLLDAVDCTDVEEVSHGTIIQCGGKYWQMPDMALPELVLEDQVKSGDTIRIEGDRDRPRVFINDVYVDVGLEEVSERKADIILAEDEMTTGRISFEDDSGIEVREDE